MTTIQLCESWFEQKFANDQLSIHAGQLSADTEFDSTGFESKGTSSSGGTKEVFMGLPAKSALLVDGAQSLTSTQKNQILTNIGSDDGSHQHCCGDL